MERTAAFVGVVVGDSGTGKSPGGDCLMRDVLPTIERQMVGDYSDRLHEWQSAVEFDKIAMKRWKDELREAQEKKKPLPLMPKPTASDIAPEKPRLRQHDVTIEQAGAVLATAAPKGMMMVRDEIAGWLMGMQAYNPASRAFWLEAYGGRPYRVERRSHGKEPIEIERLAVAVYGGTQPERLFELSAGPDDGLFSRILWLWPDPVPFRLGEETPGVAWAIEALDRLRELDLAPGNPPRPILMPLTPDAQRLMEEFGKEMEARLSKPADCCGRLSARRVARRYGYRSCSSGCGAAPRPTWPCRRTASPRRPSPPLRRWSASTSCRWRSAYSATPARPRSSVTRPR